MSRKSARSEAGTVTNELDIYVLVLELRRSLTPRREGRL